MYILRNALRCIGRSKARNALIGIIVLVIAVSACIGLSIRQAAQSAKEDTLAELTVTATIAVDRQSMMENMQPPGAGGGFDREVFADKLGQTSTLTLEEYQTYAGAAAVQDFYYTVTASFDGTEDFEPVSTEGTADNSGGSGFSGGFGGGRPDGRGMSSGDFTVVGYSSDAAMTAFADGSVTIADGAVFDEGTEAYHCIVSQELATYNDLTVGDTVSLVNPNAEEEAYTLTVVGIYKDAEANESFQMMPGSDPANKLYMSYAALDGILSASADVSATVTDADTGREYETAVTGTLDVTYVLPDTDAYELFEQQVRDLGLDESYTVSSQDIAAFENSLVPLNTLSTMAGWFLVVILVIGAIILIVMNIFSIRERKYEIGVLTAIGMKKSHVAMQFLTEVFAVTMAAVIIGVGVGAVSALPVTNALLENQIASAQDKSQQVQQGFGRGDMPNIGGMGTPGNEPGAGFEGIGKVFGQGAADYVSEINSAMNFTVVLQMLGIALLLTLVAGAVSMLFVMRYEPLKILANRD